MKRVLCIDNSVASSPRKRPNVRLISLLVVGREYTVIHTRTTPAGRLAYYLKEIENDPFGFGKFRFIDVEVDDVVETVTEQLENV